MSRLKAVIFDMDGLMFDTERMTYSAHLQAAKDLQLPYDHATYLGNIGLSGQHYEDYMSQVFPDPDDRQAFMALAKHYTQALLEDPAQPAIKPGLKALLTYLQDRGIKAYIASSSKRDTISRHLASKGLAAYFTAYIGGDQVLRSKPSPDLYEQIFAMSGLDHKDQVLVLEDSKNGIIAAKAAGLPVINIPDMSPPDQQMIGDSLAILPDLHAVISYIQTHYQVN